jgi:hypothetical protein
VHTHHASRAHHERKAQRRATHQHFSKSTMRRCQRMTYKQIIQHSNCRAMMKQDLEGAAHSRHHGHVRRSAHHHSVHRRKVHHRR